MQRLYSSLNLRPIHVRNETALAHKAESKEALELRTRGFAPSLTQTEVKNAIKVLPPAAWLRLHRVARALCRHTGEADDLLQGAFHRALDGSRRCPRDIDVVCFLVGTMCSIASDWSKTQKRRSNVGFVVTTGALQKVIVDVRDLHPDPHEWLASEQEAACMKRAVLQVFTDDLVAQRLLEGIMAGLEGEELRSFTELNKTEFANKRRLVRRRIDKAFPKEFKPWPVGTRANEHHWIGWPTRLLRTFSTHRMRSFCQRTDAVMLMAPRPRVPPSIEPLRHHASTGQRLA
jgi:DNA-directed RNA polymerase specialized sigma24 family protein